MSATITNLYDLEKAIKKDYRNHKIKVLAELLLAAMNDWPGINACQIEVFCRELKEFYGHPVTLEKIENKTLDRNKGIDIWKYEASAAVAELLELSEKFFNEADFDVITQKIIDYYERDYQYSEVS